MGGGGERDGGGGEVDVCVGVVVVHEETGVAHDLEPVDDGFGGCEGVEMGVSGEFLRWIAV